MYNSIITVNQLIEIWGAILKLDPAVITYDSDFFELGGQSLSAIRCVSMICKKFNIELSVHDLFDAPTISTLVQFINSRNYRTNIDTHYTGHDQINSDINLLSITQLPAQKFSNIPQHILLTGATGFLGIYLLKYLIENANVIVHCLVRPTAQSSAEDKIDCSLNLYDVILDKSKIKFYNSDLSKSNLGLSDTLWHYLSQSIDVIYHCGADVNHLYTYKLLRPANVLSTIELIKLASTNKVKTIHYISTINTIAYKHNGFDYENWPTLIPNTKEGYTLTKWTSEKLLEKAFYQGLPVYIYRPGNIIGHSQSGLYNPKNNHFSLLLKGCIQLGFVPDWQNTFEMVPVDIVAESIIKISRSNNSQQFVYNLQNPLQISWNEFIDKINSYNYKLVKVDARQWKEEHLVSIGPENALLPFKDIYLEESINEQQISISCKKTQQLLKELGVIFPNDYDSLIKTYIKYLETSGFLDSKFIK